MLAFSIYPPTVGGFHPPRWSLKIIDPYGSGTYMRVEFCEAEQLRAFMEHQLPRIPSVMHAVHFRQMLAELDTVQRDHGLRLAWEKSQANAIQPRRIWHTPAHKKNQETLDIPKTLAGGGFW